MAETTGTCRSQGRWIWQLITVTLLMTVSVTTADADVVEDKTYSAAGPVVSTTSGLVEGQRKLYNMQWYEEFLGIPFAAPPVGDLRWQRPQPVTPWQGVLNATEYGQHCTQLIAPFYFLIGMGGVSGEDCLFVNVWVPNGVAANGDTKLPVMVWVYGGAYLFGTGEMYPGYALALQGDVIVVNFNYRVSVLGWLSTGDEGFPGNYGLWDTQAVLVWVQQNIAAFSGDPNSVTLFGQSAGAGIVSHSVISPQMRGLFHRAIAISGGSASTSGVQEHPMRLSAILSDIFNCTNVQTSTDLMNCLKVEDAHELDFWGSVGPILYDSASSSAQPVVDGQMVPMMPRDSFQQGYGRYVNYITGATYHDGASTVIGNPIALPALGDKNNWAATNESLVTRLLQMLGGTTNAEELVADIFQQYPDMNTDDNMTRTLETTRAMTDWWFASSTNWEAGQHADYTGVDNPSTYHYQFQHRQSFLVGYPSWVNGSHVDDLYSVFGHPFMEVYRQIFLRADFDALDDVISQNIMNYYINFAYTGNPNQGPMSVPVHWTEFHSSQQDYLHEAPTFSMQRFDAETLNNYQYWMDFPSKMEFPPDPTFPLPDGVHRRLTEDEIADGVTKFRQQLGRQLSHFPEVLDAILAQIDDIVDARNARVARSTSNQLRHKSQ